MQIKAIIKKIAAEKGISAQLALQHYLLERILERVSVSKYNNKIILKGGLLIASMFGLDKRATMDMDATIKGAEVSRENTLAMFQEIVKIDVGDEFTFCILGITSIRPNDDYSGFRISLTGDYPPMSIPIKLDITTGDKITPKEIQYQYSLMFEDKTIEVLAYTAETILAEKLETVLSRGTQNTRPRDFYDIYIFEKLYKEKVNCDILSEAIIATSAKRGTTESVRDWIKILKAIQSSEVMQDRWRRYQREIAYAKGIGFDICCEAIRNFLYDCRCYGIND